jgi:hypothetical protein
VEYDDATLDATAEALCNLWGTDHNNPDAYAEARAYAPTFLDNNGF